MMFSGDLQSFFGEGIVNGARLLSWQNGQNVGPLKLIFFFASHLIKKKKHFKKKKLHLLDREIVSASLSLSAELCLVHEALKRHKDHLAERRLGVTSTIKTPRLMQQSQDQK